MARRSAEEGWSGRYLSSSHWAKGSISARIVGSPIDFTYKLPFAFTGKIDHVTIELKPEAAGKN
jgi:hypothetical protein